MTIADIQKNIEGGATPEQIAAEFSQTVEAKDHEINAFLSRDVVMADASRSGKTLYGVPIAVKDVIMTKGIKTTAASRMLEHHVAVYDAHVVEQLKDAGATIFGKTNCDEFAMGASTEQSAFGPVRNPVNPAYVPGGSSGGSAAAVAADLCVAALGSDTGGSIRQPAAFCGLVGLKPTYGRVSRYGLIALCSSFDTIGPITNNVTDAAIVFEAIAGYDHRDATTIPSEVPRVTEQLSQSIEGLRVGVPKEYFVEGMDSEVEQLTRAMMKRLESLGAVLVDVSLPLSKYAVPTYYVILPAEASSNLARFDGMRYGTRYRSESPESGMSRLWDAYSSSRAKFGPEPKRRMMIGSFVLSSGYADQYYKQAQYVRAKMKQEMDDVFKTVDVMVSATTPTPAFKLGERVEDPLKMYLADVLTSPANITGIPAISIPSGVTREGLPVGFQIMGKPLDEATMLRVAYQLEQAL